MSQRARCDETKEPCSLDIGKVGGGKSPHADTPHVEGESECEKVK